jgi:hypothetical protein
MNYDQLVAHLQGLGVTPIDYNRAALYVDHLDEAHTFFCTTLATLGPIGLGPNYSFVQGALESAALLTELANILDYYVSPGVSEDMKRVFATGLGSTYTYDQYFQNTIFDPDKATFDANVVAFGNRFPIPRDALVQLSTNFKNNVAQACRRVIDDRACLTTFFQGQYEDDFTILSLENIKSTGSDFHKGGQQVLILTFDIVHTVDYGEPVHFVPTRELLKVVYKPGDLEVDCLLLGQAGPVNDALKATAPNGFMTASLLEIYNKRLAADATLTGLPLTTYRILPRNCTSAVVNWTEDQKLPVREAYGYMEYLNYDVSGTAREYWGFYPFASSDFIVFRSQNEQSIVRDFYRMEGALAAICGSFSITDIHIENMRVVGLKPSLIDVEISLTLPMTDISETTMLGSLGGITGLDVATGDYWKITGADSAGKAKLELYTNKAKYHQNRLWRATQNENGQYGSRGPIAVNKPQLLAGFAEGMATLRAAQLADDFDDWFDRLDRVLVRCLPYTTSYFKAISTSIFVNAVKLHAQLPAAQETALRLRLTAGYEDFDAAKDPTADPDFLALTQAMAGDDYLNLDIPVFYHRLGTKGLVNSDGITLPIPHTVLINSSGNTPTRDAVVTGVGGIFGRATFFAEPPMTEIVKPDQVEILGGANDGPFRARRKLLSDSIERSVTPLTPQSLAQEIVPIGDPGTA